MEGSTIRFSVGLVVILVVGSEAMNYLAFPRMGRSGYLAFPRMGRSGQQTVESDGDGCCAVGLKNEWVLGEDGKAEVRSICQTGSECCEGLREEVNRKPNDGVLYSMCLPECYKPQTVKTSKLGKLKHFLQH